MVRIEYVNGDTETVEAFKKDSAEFIYQREAELFIVFAVDGRIMIPREFVKSIRLINTDNEP